VRHAEVMLKFYDGYWLLVARVTMAQHPELTTRPKPSMSYLANFGLSHFPVSLAQRLKNSTLRFPDLVSPQGFATANMKTFDAPQHHHSWWGGSVAYFTARNY
jgi:hypothetical protein